MSSNERTRPAGSTRRSRRQAQRADRRANQRALGKAGTRRDGGGPSLALVTTVLALVAGVGLIAFLVLTQGSKPGGSGSSAGPNSALVAPSAATPGDLGDSPAQLGNPNAPLKLEVTEDYQCPICGTFARDDLPRLINDFIRPGLVHLTIHDVAFLDYSGTESLDAATAASCAGEQGRYWEYHDWLYANQHGERQGAFDRSRLDQIAKNVGLDTSAYDACMSGNAQRAKVQATTNAQLAKGIQSTPTFVVDGGQPLAGLPPYAQLATWLRTFLPAGASGAGASGAGASGAGASGSPAVVASPS